MKVILFIRVILIVLLVVSIIIGLVDASLVGVFAPMFFIALLGLIITALIGRGIKAFGKKD